MDFNAIEKSEKLCGAPAPDAGAESFDDIKEYKEKKLTFPKTIIKSGDVVDSIVLSYPEGKLSHHGGDGGGGSEFVLESEEYIIRVTGSYNPSYGNAAVIDSLIIHTNKGRRYGSDKIRSTGYQFEYNVDPECAVCCVYGEFVTNSWGMTLLSRLGFYQRPVKIPDIPNDLDFL
ncbi:MAG: hypothetical protein LIO79_05420 [Rikenellaceae bacterium]|nr:hypothetical protein [Rikenellaceae bacterium]